MEDNSKEYKEFIVIIANKEQLLQAYPEWFEEVKTENFSFFIEKAPEKRIPPQHRYFITPSGIVRLEGADNRVWNINKENTDILGKLNKFAAEERDIFNNGGRINNDYKSIELDDHNLQEKFIPYGDISSSDAFRELEAAHQYDNSSVE